MTTKVKFLGLLLAGMAIGTSQAASNGELGTDPYGKIRTSVGLGKIQKMAFPLTEEIQYVIYDQADNVVLRVTLKEGETKDKKLVQLLQKSDYLLDFSNTQYYRMK
jgi:hypothetical protein